MERSFQFSSMSTWLNDYQRQTEQMEESTGFDSAQSYNSSYHPQCVFRFIRSLISELSDHLKSLFSLKLIFTLSDRIDPVFS